MSLSLLDPQLELIQDFTIVKLHVKLFGSLNKKRSQIDIIFT